MPARTEDTLDQDELVFDDVLVLSNPLTITRCRREEDPAVRCGIWNVSQGPTGLVYTSAVASCTIGAATSVDSGHISAEGLQIRDMLHRSGQADFD